MRSKRPVETWCVAVQNGEFTSERWSDIFALNTARSVSRMRRDAADCGLARKARLSEYAQRFAENDIDFASCLDLTDQDLKELGVSLGHRRKMLRAIARACRHAERRVRRPPSD